MSVGALAACAASFAVKPPTILPLLSTFAFHRVFIRPDHSGSDKKLPPNSNNGNSSNNEIHTKDLHGMKIEVSRLSSNRIPIDQRASEAWEESCLLIKNKASLDQLVGLIGKLSDICFTADNKKSLSEISMFYDSHISIEDAYRAQARYKDTYSEQDSIVSEKKILAGVNAISQAYFSLADMAHDNQFVRDYIREKLKDNSLTHSQRDFLEGLVQQTLPKEVKEIMDNIRPKSTSELFNKPKQNIENLNDSPPATEKPD